MMIHNSSFVKIDFVGGIAKWKNIYQLLKEFKREGLNLGIEAIEQEPQEYIDYSQDKEAENQFKEIDINPKKHLIFSGDQETFVRLETIFNSGKLSEKLGVNVYSLSSFVRLSNWFKGVFEAGFQALSTLINEDEQLAYNFMNSPSNEQVSGGKIIDLGLTINNVKVALIIKIYPDEEEQLNIQVQLHPNGIMNFLPPNIKLVMLTTAGKELQKVESRSSDNYIQLLPFKNKIGKSFLIQIRFEQEMLLEQIFTI